MCKELMAKAVELNADLGLNSLKIGAMDLEEVLEMQGIAYEVRMAIEDVISSMQSNINVIESRKFAGMGKKVVVTGSQENGFWYKDMVGVEFEIIGETNEEDYEGWITTTNKLVIDKRDCEVIS